MVKTRIFVSDFHIGPRHHKDHFESQREFVEFLEELDKTHDDIELILLGDIFCYVRETLQENPMLPLLNNLVYQAFFRKLKQFASKHTVYFVVGNHDSAACWNKEIQKTLKSLNIRFYKGQVLYYDHIYKYGDKRFKLYAEHGNQFDITSRYTDIFNPLDMPVFHRTQTFALNRIEDFAYKTQNEWLKDISLIKPVERILSWFYSKYFYNELHRLLRYTIAPLFAGFVISKLLLIFVLVYFIFLRKYISISPIIWPIFIIVMIFLVVDFSFFIMLIIYKLLKKDFKKKWDYYKVEFNFNLNKSIWVSTKNKIIRLLQNKGPKLFGDTKDTNFFIFGHFHEPHLKLVKIKNVVKGWVDIGSWRKNMLRVDSWFKLPSVYVPTYNLTYFKIYQNKDKIITELRSRYKRYKPRLTLMEKLAIFRKWKQPLHTGKDTLLRRVIFELR